MALALVAASVALAPAPAMAEQTQVVFDGYGSPGAVGFQLEGAGFNWVQNSNNGTLGSDPGYFYQKTSTVNTDAHWYYNLSAANNDLSHADGWFIEMRYRVLATEPVDEGFGLANLIRSASGTYYTRIGSAGVTIGSTTYAYPTANTFHTLRYQVDPGDAFAELILDGVSQGAVPFTGGVSGRQFTFGDHSISGDGNAIWDYVVLNEEAPAPAPRPADFGRQWVRSNPLTIAATATGSNPNFDINDYLGLNLTSVFANNNPPVAEAAAAAGVPWQLHYNTSPRPFAPYSADDKQNIAQIMNLSHATAWLLPDEPVQTSEYVALAQSAQWMKANYPWLLTYVNVGRGDGLSHAFLEEVIETIQPDALMFDWYPFKNDGSTDTNRYFADLTSVRVKTLEAGIPYWGMLQAFHIAGRDERTPSESDTRYNGFTLLTAGYTGLVYFAYDNNGLFLTSNGNPTTLYSQAAAANLEYARLGKSLRFLTSTDIRFVPGKHVVGAGTQDNVAPTGVPNWSAGSGGDTHLQSVSVDFAQPGHIGLTKDGFIGFFTDDEGEQYFMLTNLNHGAGQSAASTALSFVLTFDSSIDAILRLNRLTGEPEKVVLVNHVLNLTLPGGTGDLFKYRTGDFAGIPSGDADLDGDVDIDDLGILASFYGGASGGRWSKGDFDLDGDVDLADLTRLATNYGWGGYAQAMTDFQLLVSVPEPGVTLGALATPFVVRRRRSL